VVTRSRPSSRRYDFVRASRAGDAAFELSRCIVDRAHELSKREMTTAQRARE